MPTTYEELLGSLRQEQVPHAERMTRDERREVGATVRGWAYDVASHERAYLLLTMVAMRVEETDPASEKTPRRSEQATAAWFWILDSARHRPVRFTDDQVSWALQCLSTRLPQPGEGPRSFWRAVLAILHRAEREPAGDTTREWAAQLARLWPDQTVMVNVLFEELAGLDPNRPVDSRDTDGSLHAMALRHTRSWSPEERRSLIDLEDQSALAHASSSIWTGIEEVDVEQVETVHASLLALDPARVSDASALVQAAEDRAVGLRRGTVAYRADHLFTRLEVDAIARAAAVLLAADAPGAGAGVVALIESAAIAPTEAATAPSQAAAYALGQWVTRLPTPESVLALTELVPRVRHKGLATRLARFRQRAAKNLPLRPAVALRTALDQKPSTAAKRTFISALQGQLALDTWWSFDEWSQIFPSGTWQGSVARQLVFEHSAGGETPWFSFMIAADSETSHEGAVPTVDAVGAPGLVSGGLIRLWHPVRASTDERQSWRSRIWDERIAQPFPQALREYYSCTEPGADREFAGFEVELKTLLGVALSEGWRVNRDGVLERRFGPTSIRLPVDTEVYPGMEGRALTRSVDVSSIDGAAHMGELPSERGSEVMRAVDLLVSTSALERSPAPTGARTSPETRFFDRIAVRAAVVEHVHGADERVRIDGRRVRVGDYAVHLATGRVVLDGDPVTLPDAAPVRRPFVGSDERILLAVLDALDRLLA